MLAVVMAMGDRSNTPLRRMRATVRSRQLSLVFHRPKLRRSPACLTFGWPAQAISILTAPPGHALAPAVKFPAGLKDHLAAMRPRRTFYVLVRESGPNAGQKRVVMLAKNAVKYDAGYPELAAVGKVPRENFPASSGWENHLRLPTAMVCSSCANRTTCARER